MGLLQPLKRDERAPTEDFTVETRSCLSSQVLGERDLALHARPGVDWGARRASVQMFPFPAPDAPDVSAVEPCPVREFSL